jgi:hypothetical protein
MVFRLLDLLSMSDAGPGVRTLRVAGVTLSADATLSYIHTSSRSTNYCIVQYTYMHSKGNISAFTHSYAYVHVCVRVSALTLKMTER